eukprot:CAMPEP_0185271070 /NCGR_PEP_ID=MMETSP1359-20130426/43857_1 /TAXON_ID=552665 /ORGANISM="Bigelowiella longifila, Strain CCMP242" /LENGTH=56 /DNA_ID=CAMNT_0027862887 /DNA_START=319 /DNA_END=489 /DNA_ORIENTATION=-
MGEEREEEEEARGIEQEEGVSTGLKCRVMNEEIPMVQHVAKQPLRELFRPRLSEVE